MSAPSKSAAAARTAASANAPPPLHRGTAFSDMPRTVKFQWVLKLIACILSFGFIFPNVMQD